MKNKLVFLSALCVISSPLLATDIQPGADNKTPNSITGATNGEYNLTGDGFYSISAGTDISKLTVSGTGDTDIFLKSSGGSSDIVIDIKSATGAETTALDATSGTLRIGTTYYNPASSETVNLKIKNTGDGTTTANTTVFNVDNFLLQRMGWSNTTTPRVATLTMSVESNLTVNVKSSFKMLEPYYFGDKGWGDGYANPDPVFLTVGNNSTMKLVDNSGNNSATFVLRGFVGAAYNSNKIANVTVDSGSTLDMGLIATIGGQTANSKDALGVMDIRGTLIANNTMTFENGGTLALNGGTLQTNKTVTFNNGATFEARSGSSTATSGGAKINFGASSNFVVSSGATLSINDDILTIDNSVAPQINGTLTIKKSSSSNSAPMKLGNFMVLSTGTLNLQGGAIVSVRDGTSFSGKLTGTSSGTLLVSSKDTLRLETGSSVESGAQIRLHYGGILELAGQTNSIARITAALGSGSTINVYASNVISDLYISGTDTSLYMWEQDAILEITKLQGNGDLKIYNFEDNVTKIKIGDNLLTSGAVIELYDNLENFLGNAVINNGFLALVPEPAHWAVIFGSIALAFASFRRRK